MCAARAVTDINFHTGVSASFCMLLSVVRCVEAKHLGWGLLYRSMALMQCMTEWNKSCISNVRKGLNAAIHMFESGAHLAFNLSMECLAEASWPFTGNDA